MPDLLLKAIFLAGFVAQIAIRIPFDRRRRQNKIVASQVSRQERIIAAMLMLGSVVLPLAYVFTPWLSFADYNLPDSAVAVGVVLLTGGIILFWRAHVDLGRNWSTSLEIREGHSLITDGIYSHIRHPIYASHWLFVIAQILLLQNWITGLGGFMAFLPMYFLRVPREERMMLQEFGERYRGYVERTGRVLPRWQ